MAYEIPISCRHKNLQQQNAKKTGIVLGCLRVVVVLILLIQADLSCGQIVVHPSAGKTAEEIVKEVFMGEGVKISNVTFNGCKGRLEEKSSVQFATFTNDTTGFPDFFSYGIVLCSGNSKAMEGPNDGIDITVPVKEYPAGLKCEELEELVRPYSVNHPAILEFDFSSVSNHVAFRYFFATEEYPQFSCSVFNDVFGFFVNDASGKKSKNIALIPGTDDAVSVNNIHPAYGAGCNAVNEEYLTMLPLGSDLMEFNGYVGPFIAEADLKPNHKYHIKLAISNVSDLSLESAVFVEARSFNAVDDNGLIVKGDKGDEPQKTYSKTDTLAEKTIDGLPLEDLIRKGSVDGLAIRGLEGYLPIDTSKYDITAETDYDYLFDEVSVDANDSALTLKLKLYGPWCNCFFPDRIPARVILTPKVREENELKRIVVPIIVPVIKRTPWLLRCYWVLIVQMALLLLLLYLRALLRKNRFHKSARLRNSYYKEDDPKEVHKIGKALRQPGFGPWLNRWLNPFTDERMSTRFVRPKTGTMTFIASPSKNRILMTPSSFDAQRMIVPNYNPRPKDKKDKEGEPIGISAGTSIEIRQTQGGTTTRLGHLQYVVDGKDDIAVFQLFCGMLIGLAVVAIIILVMLMLRAVI